VTEVFSLEVLVSRHTPLMPLPMKSAGPLAFSHR
jgi:hypothetical protein